MENLEFLIKKLGQNIKKFKNPYFLHEAYEIFTYKSPNGYKFIHYITATALLMFVFFIGFLIFAFLSCFGVVSSLNKINPITFTFLFLSILIVNIFLSPFLHGYLLMVYKDVYGELKSDLSDFFFFIHSFDKNKKNYLVEGYIFSFVSLLILVISFIVAIGIINILMKFIPNLPIVSFIIALTLKIVTYWIVFSFSLPLVIISVFYFIQENRIYFSTNIKDIDMNLIGSIRNVFGRLIRIISLYFSNLRSFVFIGSLMSIGAISIIGNLVTFPMGSIMLAIVLRKK
ncbi:MAG: hypothetical protein RMJ51_01580 [Candidatus Calescibacterium sp.]|nr:hypothetical protein [Candidatus Calescibacterium sp.]MDW8194920.1 hypothetical protein [Candidatus Calescibacterium sp.]